MTDNIITDEHLEDGERSPTLGPHYFSSRDVVHRIIENFQSEQFKPLIDDFAKDFANKLWNDVESSLLCDVECNVQGSIWRTVDQIVRGILSGEKWIVDRYALGERYDCDKARETIARHVPKELQDARIADLEAELKSVKEDNDWLRNR